MESNQARPQNMIDTTDALEAVTACQAMKNFLFTLILIGLVLCQIVFWMAHFGLINKDGCGTCKNAVQESCSPQVCPSSTDSCPIKDCPKIKPQARAEQAGPIFLAATTDEPAAQAETVAAEAEEVKDIEEAIDQIVESANQTPPETSLVIEQETDMMPAEIPTEHASPEMLEPQPSSEIAEAAEDTEKVDPLSLFRISCSFACGLVAVCNFIIVVSVILYSLLLLMCLKISLAGRLGGINHITRAFFISLFLLVVIIPWQVVLPKILIGTIWLPGELLCGGWAKADSSIIWKVLFYLRFCALPFVSLWFLLWTQIRTGKWTRATLRRLGVVR